jgi:hypothetical protein
MDSRIRGTQEYALSIYSYIQLTQSKLISIFNEMLKDGDINLDLIIDKFFDMEITPVSI